MKDMFDPFTEFLNRYAWAFWALLWISLCLGIGQEEVILSSGMPALNYNTTTITTVVTILLWGAVILQTVRQMYYSHLGHSLVRLGRWMILGATSIFAFRMTYMLALYGGVPSSYATLVGVGILAIGISLNALGMMQQHYFQEYGRKQPKWGPHWRAI